MNDVPSQSRPILLSAEKTAAPRRARALPKTPLALAVLNLLSERAIHPYEMKSMMIERGHLRAIRLKDASLYDTVERLATLGFIESIGVRREGRRPERTVYSITQSGRDELLMWMQELVSTPSREYPSFAAALMFIYALGREKAIAALAKRGALLEGEISRIDTYQKALATDLAAVYAEMLQRRSTEFPRLFRVEEEYAQAMRRAELAWIRQTIRDLRDGTLPWPDLGGPEESDQ
jgi:DNA-binding PadR family transcriptional regulator